MQAKVLSPPTFCKAVGFKDLFVTDSVFGFNRLPDYTIACPAGAWIVSKTDELGYRGYLGY
jgi:hypothetical protein